MKSALSRCLSLCANLPRVSGSNFIGHLVKPHLPLAPAPRPGTLVQHIRALRSPSWQPPNPWSQGKTGGAQFSWFSTDMSAPETYPDLPAQWSEDIKDEHGQPLSKRSVDLRLAARGPCGGWLLALMACSFA